MARAGVRKVQRYSLEFKLAAVRLTKETSGAPPPEPVKAVLRWSAEQIQPDCTPLRHWPKTYRLTITGLGEVLRRGLDSGGGRRRPAGAVGAGKVHTGLAERPEDGDRLRRDPQAGRRRPAAVLSRHVRRRVT